MRRSGPPTGLFVPGLPHRALLLSMPSTMFRRMSLFADDPLPRVTGAAFQGDRVPWAKATRSSYRASRNRLTWWEAAFFKGPNNESDGAAARATLCYYGYSPPRRPGWLRSSRTHWGPCTNCPRSGASVTSLPFPFRSLTHRGGGHGRMVRPPVP
jgi:hypothetical protein